MKYCAKCGQQLNDDVRFCGKCGNESGQAQVIESAAIQESNSSGPNIEVSNSFNEIAATNQVSLQTEGNWSGAGGQSDTQGPIYTPPRQERSRWPLILAGILGVLLLGAFLLYHYGNFGPPETVKLAPADTELFICVKPNLLQLRNFSNLQDIYQSNSETKAVMEELLKEFRQETDVDYELDIKPWLGKEAAAFIPRQENPEELVAVIQYKDREKARQFIKKLTKDEDTREEAYRGIAVTCVEDDWVALTDGFMFIASNEELMHATIDRKLGKRSESLEDNYDYRKVEKSLPWNRSAFCFININEISNSLKQSNNYSDIPYELYNPYRCLGLSLSAQKQGIRCDYVLTFKQIPEYMKNRNTQKAEVKEFLSLLPEDTLGFVRNSNCMNMARDDYDTFYNNFGEEMDIPDIEHELDIDFRDDVVDVLRGDIALAIMPQKGRFFGQGNVPVSGVMMLGVKDQQQAGNTLQKVFNIMEENDVSVNHRQINGSDTYFLGDSYSGDACALGIQNQLVIMGSSPGITEKVLEKNGGSINKQQQYKRTFAGLPGSWEPQAYLDIEKAIDLLPAEEMGSDGRMFISLMKPIKSLGQASSAVNTRKSLIQGAAVVTIAK